MMNDTSDEELPPYDWDVAEVGDSRRAFTLPVERSKIDEYIRVTDDDNPIYAASATTDDAHCCAVPLSMLIHIAPTGRAEIMRANGARPPRRPTPFARLQAEYFAPIRQGDVVTTESKLAEKYERRGRRYLVWDVTAWNQRGEQVLHYRQHNAWDNGKPEDRDR